MKFTRHHLILIVAIALAAAGTGGFFWYNNARSAPINSGISSTNSTTSTSTTETAKTPSESPTDSVAKTEEKPADTKETATKQSSTIIHWGAVVRAYGMNKPYSTYQKDQMIKQLDYLKELGTTDSRANIEWGEDNINDDFVNLSLERGLKPTLVVEPVLGDFWNEANYYTARAFAKKVAERYKGKVPYYQLANEASGVVIKPGFGGSKETDYQADKYDVFKEWLRGLSDGIKDGDPAAKRIISANWIGTGVIDKLIKDKVGFEIIGWNWYSDMGEDLIKKVDGQTLNIPEHFKNSGKEFWVVELNRREGTLDGNKKKQADYLQKFITNVNSHNNIQGIFIFTLTDLCDILDKDTGRLGLIELKKNSDSSCSVVGKKPSFDTYKDLISKYK